MDRKGGFSMKQKLFCLIVLLCLMFCPAALANEWGAPGDTVDLFDGTDYNDYSVTAEDYSRQHDKVHLVVESRYHQQLLLAEKVNGQWQIMLTSTKAVWQPEDPQVTSKWPELEWADGGFTLLYKDESYRFDEELILQEARCNGLTFTYQGNDIYWVEQRDTIVQWEVPGGLFLPDFNIRLMPRSLEEVKHLNALYQQALDFFTFNADSRSTADEKLSVYSTPGQQGWRAANGKASVNLNDSAGLYTFHIVENGWELIQYQVSLRTSRIGYIHHGDDSSGFPDGLGWQLLPTVTTTETYFTDDPGVSQYQQAKIPSGTAMTMLGRWGWDYAYVETMADGKPARGFIPLRDVALRTDILEAAALDLPGSYQCFQGGEVLGNSITFHEDGTFTLDTGVSGHWAISDMTDAGIVLDMTYPTGEAVSYTLVLRTNGLSASFLNDAGGGSYILQ